MRKSLKVSRGLQLAGALLLIVGIVSCTNRIEGLTMAASFAAGITLVIGARIYEWLTKE